MTGFSIVSLLLAAVGIYGLLSYIVTQRTTEFGVRLALGARPAQIRTLIFSHGMQLFVVGCGIGLLSAVALSRLLKSVLFEVSLVDPKSYLIVGAVLFFATFVACWIPARRASRVDPIAALRSE